MCPFSAHIKEEAEGHTPVDPRQLHAPLRALPELSSSRHDRHEIMNSGNFAGPGFEEAEGIDEGHTLQGRFCFRARLL